ncbi:UDP-N-acetylmuramoyl-L-alanine--D-glutamate ligase [Salinisphaera sp. LB1]|uniref:UDP-N-acetylmuramoyl-L-alanine--D-glutamate ligase n=1 Tax=Salinisphaera sp. LB1 TaxID=2183911 RepID=UPI000D7054BD|nr:UDP-N-acetylmuramoyl-L-alanine--D-glutamate ligase [Salinisphaera sp. LB1]AWN16523.1 UDP-N-acetylmuramoylalanine--D-glutamate ligase [Salinisphaera sp. LB1]
MNDWKAQLANARVLVVGCGATGASAARFAAAAGARVRVVDSREKPPAADALARDWPAIGIVAGGLDPATLEGVDHVVISPGVDLREPLIAAARAAGHEIIGDIEWFARVANAPVVAITGSNGKSTVTAWIGEIAAASGRRVAVGGNFGTPALDLLAADIDLYVLELSSFQLELTERLHCVAATVLNVSADHIDRHGSLEHYAGLKARIFRAAELALVNADDARVAAMDTHDARVVRFGTGETADYRVIDAGDGLWLARGNTPWFDARQLQLAGRHNAANAAAVWALAEALGIDAATIRDGLRHFAGLAYRCQLVAEIDGVRWVNDSKGTNLGAMLASLTGMDGPVVLLAGGQGKGADFAALGAAAGERARAVLVFGEDADVIAAAVTGHVPVERVDTLAVAVRRAAEIAQDGDVVLLSPGCASFDQFDNYQARGEAFTAAVRELAA